MKFIALVVIAFCITSCSTQKCKGSHDLYRNVYKRYLIIMKDSKKPRKMVMPFEHDKSLMFLSAVSGISANITIQHYIAYRNMKDLKQDIHKWQRWYKKNKCSITLSYVDSLVKVNGYDFR